MKSNYYDTSVQLGTEFQKNNPKNWAGYDVVKYQDQIKDLVQRYNAKTILDYGCGKGLQYTEKLPWGMKNGVEPPLDQWTTFDKWLGVDVYKYDPCVPGLDISPPVNMKFDGVICGHIHHAEIKDIDGIKYMNDGDWVESCTALVEHHDGRWEIITWTKEKDNEIT